MFVHGRNVADNGYMSAAKSTAESLKVDLQIGVEGRDQLSLKGLLKKGKLESLEISAIGCLSFLEAVQALKKQLVREELSQIPLPVGETHEAMLMRELLLKLTNSWEYPYPHEELCHCRVVATAKVDAAVLSGARTAEEIARTTSAGSGCGTCRKDSEKIIRFRLGKS